MPKKPAKIFCLSSVFLVGIIFLFLPDFAFADGTYRVYFKDKTGNVDFNKYLEVKYDGFVPCGKCLEIENPIGISVQECSKYLTYETQQRCASTDKHIYLNCEFCHFFVMINELISFLLIKLIPPIALLMLVIGGVMFYLGGAKPDMLSRAKKLMIGVGIGLFLIYGAYMIIGVFLTILDMADVSSVGQIYQNGVFTIDCPVKIQCE